MKLSDQITRRHLFVAFGSSAQTGTLSSVDLAATRDGSSVTLTASDGSVAPILGADASTAGVLTAADKVRLDELPPTSGQHFSARADVAAAAVGASITHLRTAGYAEPGDGGGALYKRAGAEPAHALKVQSADGAWWELLPDAAGMSIKQAGAKGDGASNDTTPFQDMAAWIEAQGGGTILVPEGTYIVGRQTSILNGATAYAMEEIFEVAGLARPLRIIGSEAAVKIADGLRYGAFDPTTGAPADNASVVSLRNVFKFDDCASVEIENLEIDGNNTQLLLGGTTSGSRQHPAYNIQAWNCDRLLLRNVHTHHAAQDNIYIAESINAIDDDREPKTLINVTSEYAARQGLTWAGGKGLVALNCKFNHTGRAVNQGGGDDNGLPFGSSPQAGLDIEAERGPIRDGHFIGCEFVNNGGSGMIAFTGDTADVVFDNCLFWGTTNAPINVNKPRFTFRRSKIFGLIEVLHAPANAINGVVHPDASHFLDCEFEDRPWSDGNVHTGSGGRIFIAFAEPGWLIEGGVIRLVNGTAIGDYRGGTLRRVHIESHIGAATNRNSVMRLDDTLVEDCYINDVATHTTADGYYIVDTAGTIYRNSYINSPEGKLKWNNWWTGGGGHAGPSGQGSTDHPDRAALHVQALHLHRNQSRSAYRLQKVASDDAAPTSGTWDRGDMVLNYAGSAAGDPLGWYCVTAGSPGTWQELRCAGTQQAKIADPAAGTTIDAEARTAINAIIDVLEHFGLSATT